MITVSRSYRMTSGCNHYHACEFLKLATTFSQNSSAKAFSIPRQAEVLLNLGCLSADDPGQTVEVINIQHGLSA